MQYRLPLLRHRTQKGSILVQFALLTLVLLTVLGVVQIGYMYSTKRDLQRIADLAALESAGAFRKGATDCSNANAAGVQSVTKQWPFGVTHQGASPEVKCGTWSTNNGFLSVKGTGGTYNAASVTLTGQSLQLVPFTGDRIISATAIATRSEPIAQFSVGAQLLCGTLLGDLTGVNLCALNSSGVLNAKTTPAGLLKALGVNLDLGALTPAGVTQIPKFSVASIIQATSVSLIGEQTANIFTNILGQISTSIGNVQIPLIGTPTSPGLFTFASLGGGKLGNAADVQVRAFDVIGTALAIGSKDRGMALGAKLSLLNLASSELRITSPPSIAIGPASNPAITKAYNSQVRLNLTIGIPGFLNFPLSADLINGEGGLEKISCNQKPETVDIRVNSSIGKICLGDLNPSGTTCSPVPLLLGLATVKSEANLLPTSSQLLANMKSGESRMTNINNLQIGTTVSSLVTNLEVKLIGLDLLGVVTGLVSTVLKPALLPLLNGVGSFLSGPVLHELLGLDLGQTQVDALDIQCSTTQLVK
ncbi:pilus assembly protein TadG-related protein [Alicycliphilus sp. T452]